MANMANYIYFTLGFSKFKQDRLTGKTESRGRDPLQFEQNIDNVLQNVKVFEISDSIKKMLLLTNTPTDNENLHLPFENMFIDTEIIKEELDEICPNSGVDGIKGILFRVNDLFVDDDNTINNIGIGDKVVGKNLAITALCQVNDFEYTEFNTLGYPLWVEKEYENTQYQETTFVKKKVKKLLYNFVVNFLNFINNPEIEYLEHKRDEKTNARRIRQRKIPLPNSIEVKVTGTLKIYLDRIISYEKFNYSHRFWVRGHFRTLRDERYKENVGKRIWILPFIKGSGILVNKAYEVGKN